MLYKYMWGRECAKKVHVGKGRCAARVHVRKERFLRGAGVCEGRVDGEGGISLNSKNYKIRA